MRWFALASAVALGGLGAFARELAAQGHHPREPIRYRHSPTGDNAVQLLQRRLDQGELQLPAAGERGRLDGLLAALGVPVASQVVVWSRTALQRHRVSPQTPRALWFGPDVYVGYVPGSAALELAVGDDRLGLVFYTLPQDPAARAVFTRDDSCLSCHASERTHDEPGLLLRSVFADADGDVIQSAGDVDMTIATPLAERWGGWLVTGEATGLHRGNGVAARADDGRWRVQPASWRTLAEVAAPFAVGELPAPGSDIGALTVLLAQTTVQNALLRAGYEAQVALQQPDDARRRQRLAGLADEVVAALRLTGEVPLRRGEVVADRAFVAAFAAQWPRDDDGTTLGAIDFGERTFVAPLSPMLLSPAFARLPEPLRSSVMSRLRAGLAADSRLLRHLRDHLPGFAATR